jgi:hypothetical protein
VPEKLFVFIEYICEHSYQQFGYFIAAIFIPSPQQLLGSSLLIGSRRSLACCDDGSHAIRFNLFE